MTEQVQFFVRNLPKTSLQRPGNVDTPWMKASGATRYQAHGPRGAFFSFLAPGCFFGQLPGTGAMWVNNRWMQNLIPDTTDRTGIFNHTVYWLYLHTLGSIVGKYSSPLGSVWVFIPGQVQCAAAVVMIWRGCLVRLWGYGCVEHRLVVLKCFNLSYALWEQKILSRFWGKIPRNFITPYRVH